MLRRAEQSSHQATELAQKLLTFSKGGWLFPKRITLPFILEDTIAHYPEMKSMLQNAELRIPPDLDPIYGDDRQLRQVMFNLMQNAREAMADVNPNRLTISAYNITLLPENDLNLNEGNYIKITISDNGRGIPPDAIQNIFDPYFSTKDTVTRKGMGMGLAICYSIIQKHNGHIAVDSIEGKGTTITIYLPAYGPGTISVQPYPNMKRRH
ncbi:MAG: HAMP domain-containing histidine kinase [bacterium]|nr:HAMP domain-containing histidine kinase [bacterium]